jgi:hypothetical protein
MVPSASAFIFCLLRYQDMDIVTTIYSNCMLIVAHMPGRYNWTHGLAGLKSWHFSCIEER